MNSLMEIEKERETKLKSAKIEDGFHNIIGGQRSAAASEIVGHQSSYGQRAGNRSRYRRCFTGRRGKCGEKGISSVAGTSVRKPQGNPQ